MNTHQAAFARGGEPAPVGAQKSDLQKLMNRVEVTRECRFAAQKRLSRRHKLSYYLISILSLFVIFLSLLPNIFTLSTTQTQLLLAITIVNSVFIIITTLVDSAGNYGHSAYLLKKSGRELSNVFNAILLADRSSQDDQDWLRNQQKAYQEILDSCPIDHEDVDYLATQLKKGYLFRHIHEGRSADAIAAWKRRKKMRLHYERARWLIPHVVMLAISCIVLLSFCFGAFSGR